MRADSTAREPGWVDGAGAPLGADSRRRLVEGIAPNQERTAYQSPAGGPDAGLHVRVPHAPGRPHSRADRRPDRSPQTTHEKRLTTPETVLIDVRSERDRRTRDAVRPRAVAIGAARPRERSLSRRTDRMRKRGCLRASGRSVREPIRAATRPRVAVLGACVSDAEQRRDASGTAGPHSASGGATSSRRHTCDAPWPGGSATSASARRPDRELRETGNRWRTARSVAPVRAAQPSVLAQAESVQPELP